MSEREKERVCVRVCLRERERKRERVCVRVCLRETERERETTIESLIAIDIGHQFFFSSPEKKSN